MATFTSSIYFNRSGTTKIEFGVVDLLHRAQVSFRIGNTEIHKSVILDAGQEDYDWKISDEEKALIISLIPTNATSVKGIMRRDVYSIANINSTMYDKEVEVTFILEETESTKPIIRNTVKKALDLTQYVQGKSRLQYKLDATAINNATVKNVTVKVRGVACTLVSIENDTYEFKSGLLAYSGTNTITVEVTDTRGFKRTITESVYVYPYAPPIISSLASEDGIVCKRWDAIEDAFDEINGTSCQIKISVAMSYVPEILKKYSVYYRYKVNGGTAWSDEKLIGTMEVEKSGSTTFRAVISDVTFNVDFEYDIELRVEDELSGENNRYEQLPSSKVSFNIAPRGLSAAFGKYADLETVNFLDTSWDIHTDGNIQAEGSIYSDNDLLVAKAIKGSKLFLNGIEVEATAQELSHTKGSSGNFQSQLNVMSNRVGWAEEDITDLTTKISSLESRIKALESK